MNKYCDRCGGLGKLGVLSNIQTDPKATMPCPDCNGTGLKKMSETGVAAHLRKLWEDRPKYDTDTILQCDDPYEKLRNFEDWCREAEKDVLAVLATHQQQLRAYFTELNDESKIVLDEIERGCFKRPKDVFDRMFDLAENLRQQIMGGGVEATTP